MMNTVFMFPGQGSQSVAMRASLGVLTAAQKKIFTDLDAILGFRLTDVIDHGPDEELTRTANTQPALLAMDAAYSDAMMGRGYRADAVMGHSLGEYAALVHAGVLSFEDGVRIVRRRGELMERAVVDSPGKMAAVVGADAERLKDIIGRCQHAGVVEITNFNSPVQVVLSGEQDAVDEAMRIIHEEQAGRAMELNVSAPFHSSLMRPIAEDFRTFLDGFTLRSPVMAFIDNVTGDQESDPLRIREKLVEQLYRPVLWEQSVRTALGLGVKTFVECGPGAVLTGLVKRIDRSAELINGERVVKG